MNKVILKGRITKDLELKYLPTKNGMKPRLQFSIACNRDKENVDFINCISWEKTAEFINQYFSKGQEILIEGELKSRSWQDEQQKNRYVLEVLILKVEFCGSKQNGNTNINEMQNMFEPNFNIYDVDDEDLPF